MTKLAMLAPGPVGGRRRKALRSKTAAAAEEGTSEGLPTVFGGVYASRSMETFSGRLAARCIEDQKYAKVADAGASSRLELLAVLDNLGFESDYRAPLSALAGGRPRAAKSKVYAPGAGRAYTGHVDAFAVARSLQAPLGVGLSPSIAAAKRRLGSTRFCANSRFSGVHTDSCAHGFMTMLERTLGRHAALPRHERDRAEEEEKHEVSELEGQLLLLELAVRVKQRLNLDVGHADLSELLHASLDIGLDGERRRGRGRWSVVQLWGNGFDRLLRSVGRPGVWSDPRKRSA